MNQLYVILFDSGNYYVSVTTTPKEVILNEFVDDGTDEKQQNEWLSDKEPVEIVEYYPLKSMSEIDQKVILYMAMYGVDKVRGGSFTDSTFDKKQLAMIDKMIANNVTFCKKCKLPDHNTKDCKEAKIDKKTSFDKLDYNMIRIINETDNLSTLIRNFGVTESGAWTTLLFWNFNTFSKYLAIKGNQHTYMPMRSLHNISNIIFEYQPDRVYTELNLEYLINLKQIYIKLTHDETYYAESNKVSEKNTNLTALHNKLQTDMEIKMDIAHIGKYLIKAPVPSSSATKLRKPIEITLEGNKIMYMDSHSRYFRCIEIVTNNKVDIIIIDGIDMKYILKKSLCF
ncbi:MAG: putative endonuclease [Hyperionvirus sp.]|uniref:Putative endonuclease n=1 Tax=Hyperionvirus sp. TaxID=2487770 RepID=A0A3G5A8G2_9VIRU|nr:MAG: putative endonuclease [Hyperionvirus sp.]